MPLLFLSNALYPLYTLPMWMQIGALIGPTTYVVSGLRQTALAYAGSAAAGEVLPLWLCFLVIAAFAALGTWLAYRAFKSSVK